MAGSDREKTKRKAKCKRKMTMRALSGTPPREAEPFGLRERRRLLEALRECAQAVDAAGPGGTLPDRVKMEGLLRCLTHSINLLELDPRQPLTRRRSSSALGSTSMGPSSSCDSGLLSRGPNLHSALTSINVKNKTCRRLSSSNRMRRNNIPSKSSSSTLCIAYGYTNKYTVETQTPSSRPNETNEEDGDESSNADESGSTVAESTKTVLNAGENENLTASDREDLDTDVQNSCDNWLSSYPPSPTLPDNICFVNAHLQTDEMICTTKPFCGVSGNLTNEEDESSTVSYQETSKVCVQPRERRAQTKSEIFSARYSISSKKEEVALKPIRKSAPQERTMANNVKKAGRERSVYTVRNTKRETLLNSPKKRISPKEGDHSRVRTREKVILHHLKESARDSLFLKGGSVDHKAEKPLEFTITKPSNSALQRPTNNRIADTRRTRTADSATPKRFTRKRPISRTSSNCTKSIPEPPVMKPCTIDIPIQVSDSIVLNAPETKMEGVATSSALGKLMSAPPEKTRNSISDRSNYVRGESTAIRKMDVMCHKNEYTNLHIPEVEESLDSRKRNHRRPTKSRKNRMKDKQRNLSNLRKGNYSHILPSSAPLRKDEKTLPLEKSRSLTRVVNNQLGKCCSESRFIPMPKRHPKIPSEMLNIQNNAIVPRMTNSDRKIVNKVELSKRMIVTERSPSRTSVRWDDVQTPLSAASYSNVSKSSSRASDTKSERTSPAPTKRGHRKRHSGHSSNKNGLKSPPPPSKRSGRSQTRFSGRSLTNTNISTVFKRSNISLPTPQTVVSRTKVDENNPTARRGKSFRPTNRSPSKSDVKRNMSKKSNSGSKGSLDKSASTNSVPKEEKCKSTPPKQITGILQKSASYSGNVAEDIKPSILINDVTNDHLSRPKFPNSEKDKRGALLTEKYSSSDLRNLLTQSATKKKRVTFACFDQLQPVNIRRLKTDYIDKSQIPTQRGNEFQKLRNTSISSYASPLPSSPNETKRHSALKSRSNYADQNREKVQMPSVTKQLKSILLTANRGVFGGNNKEEKRPARQSSCNLTNRRSASCLSNDGVKNRCIPNIFSSYVESTGNDTIESSGDISQKFQRKSFTSIPLFKSSSHPPSPKTREKTIHSLDDFEGSYDLLNDREDKVSRSTPSLNLMNGQKIKYNFS